MERLLKSPGRRREEQRYPLQTRPSRASAVGLTAGLATTTRSRATGALRGEYVAPKPSDLYDFPYQLSSEIMPLRGTNEKELLHGLNDRFAAFIEKVRHLESQNTALEKEIEAVRLRAKSSASLSREYEPEMKELRDQVREMSVQKQQVELSLQSLQDELDTLRERCEQEARQRAGVEDSVRVLKKFIGDAQLAKQEMDRKAKALEDEIGFLKKNHEAEVAEIAVHIQESQARQEVSSFGRGDLTAALRDIRLQLEGHAAVCDIQPADERIRVHVAQLTRAAEINREALLTTKAEISDYRRQLQSKSVEFDSVKGMREALERQLFDLEQRHKAELHHYQDTIRELENELKNTKYDMGSHVQEYQDLLNVKMALDTEIYSYRKLLEGEESRYHILSDAHVSVPYVYRQSPTYTLPCVKRQGGAPRKAEPQYKFVEEIITETTREDVEISDTGSEDGSGAGEGDKAEKVCSEEEDTGKATESDVHTEEEDTQAPASEDDKESPRAEEEENKEEQSEKQDKSPKISPDISEASNEVDKGAKLQQKEAPAPELTDVKSEDKDETKVVDTGSESQEAETETKPDKVQDVITSDKKVPLDIEGQEQQPEKETDKGSENQPQPAEQKATPEAVTEAEAELKHPDSPPLKDPETQDKATEEVSQKNEDKKKELTDKPQDATAAKPPEKGMETSEVKSVEVDVSTAGPQPVPEKAEARQEAAPKEDSKAESKARVDTSKADVRDTPKAESKKDVGDVQKEATKQAEGVKQEAPQKNEEKETKSDPQAEIKVDSKPAGEAETEKAEKVESGKSVEAEKTQDDVSKSASNETGIETAERKESGTKGVIDSEKIDEEKTVESKEGKKVPDQMQSKEEQPKAVAVETKSEKQPENNATKEHVVESVKTEEKEAAKSTENEPEAIQKDEPPKPAEKETKTEAQAEKKETTESKPEASKDTKEADIIKAGGQETDTRTSKDAEVEPSVPKTSAEKEQSKDQTETVKNTQEVKDTKPEKTDVTGASALQAIPTADSTKTTSPEKDSALPKPDQSTEPAPKIPSKKEQDKQQKAAITDANEDTKQKTDKDMPKVAENGVPV